MQWRHSSHSGSVRCAGRGWDARNLCLLLRSREWGASSAPSRRISPPMNHIQCGSSVTFTASSGYLAWWKGGTGRHRGDRQQRGVCMGLTGKLFGNPARDAKTFMLGVIAMATAALMLVGTSSLASAAYPTGGTKQSGGTVRWAEPSGGATPNYIFPFMSATTSSVNNISQLQFMLYRPLYMIGFPNSQKTTQNSTF